MRFYRIGLALLALAAALPVLAQDGVPDLPERIEVQQRNLFPEGIEYDPAAGQFLLGSLSEGAIYRVDDAGTATVFIQDDNLIASTGIEVDEATNRLLVANTDPAAFNPFARSAQAGLGIYDLGSGERLHYVDLAPVHEGWHFINDVAVDDEGNAYVTDSFAALIYKVDPNGGASVYAESRDFVGGLLSLNGIVYYTRMAT